MDIDKDVKQAVAEALADAINAGVTKAEIADSVGVSRPTVTQWDKGLKTPSLQHYFRLLKVRHSRIRGSATAGCMALTGMMAACCLFLLPAQADTSDIGGKGAY